MPSSSSGGASESSSCCRCTCLLARSRMSQRPSSEFRTSLARSCPCRTNRRSWPFWTSSHRKRSRWPRHSPNCGRSTHRDCVGWRGIRRWAAVRRARDRGSFVKVRQYILEFGRILGASHFWGQDMPDQIPGVHSDPDILGGTPVFVGTRVPVRALLDYLEHGRPLSEFLDDFPTVDKALAIGVLEHMKQLVAHAPPSR